MQRASLSHEDFFPSTLSESFEEAQKANAVDFELDDEFGEDGSDLPDSMSVQDEHAEVNLDLDVPLEDFEAEDFVNEGVNIKSPTLKAACASNPWLQAFVQRTQLHIRHPLTTAKVYETEGVLGVFHMFMHKNFLNHMRNWTRNKAKAAGLGLRGLPEELFYAYVGLDVAMSLVKFSTLSKYWSNGMFEGHPDFQKVMGRDLFVNIRSHLQFHPSVAENEAMLADPPQRGQLPQRPTDHSLREGPGTTATVDWH
jgi:hypothetical protein